MNETRASLDPLPDGQWPGSEHRVPVPDTSMLPVAEKVPPVAVDLLNRAIRGAHTTVDQLADAAAPTVLQLGERVSAADHALHAKAAVWRQTSDEWADGMRNKVRGSPLVAVAAAIALGVLIARLTR